MCLVVGFKLGYLVHWPYQLLSQMCLAVGFKLGYWCIDLTSLFVFACCSEGGFFNAIMSFPSNYPNSPPSVRFTSEIWHPNGEYLSSVFEFLNIVISLSLSLSWTNVLNLSKLQFTQMERFAFQFFIPLVMIQMAMSEQANVGVQSIQYVLIFQNVAFLVSPYIFLAHYYELNSYLFIISLFFHLVLI